jgi:hypothetical protein
MTVDQVRAAAGVTLDRDDYCGFYTFHSEPSFGRGDGPTFVFDDAGRLRWILLGRSDSTEPCAATAAPASARRWRSCSSNTVPRSSQPGTPTRPTSPG